MMASGWLQINLKSEKSHWHHNLLTWHHYKFFWRCCVSIVKFSYWLKFHVDFMTGSGVMTIFVYKGLTRNPDMGNTISGDWVELLRDTKFGTNVPNKILLNAANGQSYCFFRFLVIMGKSTGGKITPLPRLALSISGTFTYFNIDNWQTHYQIQEFCDTTPSWNPCHSTKHQNK